MTSQVRSPQGVSVKVAFTPKDLPAQFPEPQEHTECVSQETSHPEPAVPFSEVGHKPNYPPGVFPEPIIDLPVLEHRQTFIILHGRGSWAEKFRGPLLAMATPGNETLQTAFPHAKLIFLTASRNKATIYKKSLTHQWFDNWHLEEYTKRQDLMTKELPKSCRYVHGILEKEIELVGKQNVVLWGLSQGCATSLSALLMWDGEPFAATVGMCGWLPFSNVLLEIMEDGEEDEDDVFAHSDDEGDGADFFEKDDLASQQPTTQAVNFFREEIDMQDKTGSVYKEIPVFLGHGMQDDMVPIELGREARNCLNLLGAEATMVEYQGLIHWYSPEMLEDIFRFIKDKLQIESETSEP